MIKGVCWWKISQWKWNRIVSVSECGCLTMTLLDGVKRQREWVSALWQPSSMSITSIYAESLFWLLLLIAAFFSFIGPTCFLFLNTHHIPRQFNVNFLPFHKSLTTTHKCHFFERQDWRITCLATDNQILGLEMYIYVCVVKWLISFVLLKLIK